MRLVRPGAAVSAHRSPVRVRPRAGGRPESEHEFQSELNDPGASFPEPWISGRNIRRFADCAEGRTVEIDIGETEIRAVKEIKDFSAEL